MGKIPSCLQSISKKSKGVKSGPSVHTDVTLEIRNRSGKKKNEGADMIISISPCLPSLH